MGIVSDLHNLLGDLLERYDEPRITYVAPDTRLYWDSYGRESEFDIYWEGEALYMKFGFWEIDGDEYLHHREKVDGFAPPPDWLEFMDEHFKREQKQRAN